MPIIVFATVFSLAVLTLASPAFAIPSPDIVVSFFSNTAQLLALLTAVIGSAAFSRSRALRDSSQTAPRSHWSIWLTRVLVLFLIASVGLNLLQWSREIDLRAARLTTNLTRSSTEAGRAVGDTSLKSLPFSRQINHPQGISGESLAEILAQSRTESPQRINLIDVREPEEWEVGSLSGFSHIRYPELLHRVDELGLKKSRNILLCHSGNRSSELCQELKKRGIDCSFVIGGYEKWRAEGRSINQPAETATRLPRPLPPYPAEDLLLDTPEVQSLAAQSQALFIDVRYPQEFKREHLPGAINLPIRKLRNAEIEAALKQLPARPIVAPCYDKRSCFYAQVLGLRLHRHGHDFRGRYTVPHEYSAARNQPATASAWFDADDFTILGKIQRPFDAGIRWLGDKTGSLVLAIFLAVAMLRLVLLPLTIKGERDQIVEQRLRPRIAELKSRLAHDPQRFKRAVRQMIQANGITPTRNLMGLIIQVTLLLVLISAVSAAARPGSENFLWIPDIGKPDPLYVIPVSMGFLVFIHLQLAAARKSFAFRAIRVLCGAFFALITLELSAALNIYLVSGVGLMLLQAAAIRRFVRRRDSAPIDSRGPLPQQVADLRDADRMPGAGRKAARLSLMMRHGLPVPDGFVVPNGLFSEDGQLGESNRSKLDALRKQLGLQSMAVRSSGLSEDGEDHSYAGQFETRLSVGADDLYDAVTEIYKTLHDGPAATYGNGSNSTGGGVIVQNMVDAEFAGILFTEHPMQCGTTLVELTSGLGDKLATGTEAPESYSFGRWSHLPQDAEDPPIDLHPLIQLGEQVERMFGHPQDIEWAYKNGRFYLLQARNITVLGRLQCNGAEQSVFERERHRLLEIAKCHTPDTVAFTQNELSELLPRPTPLSLDLMQALWEPGGSVDLACRALGIPYDVPEEGHGLLESVFGRLYVNDPVQRERTRNGLGPVSAFRLSRSAERIEHKFTSEFLPALIRSLLPREAMDLTTLSTPDLVTLFEDSCDRYVHETHVEVDIVNIAADFFVKSAERQFQRKGLSASTYLGQGANTVVHQAMSLLQKIREGEATPDEFLEIFGHRAPVDYELAQPRYREDRSLMENLIRDAAAVPGPNDKNSGKIATPDEPTLALAVARARRFQTLKEDAKHVSLREFSVLRRILVELDYRLGFNGEIFFLRLEEVPQVRDPGHIEELRNRCRERREAFESFATLDEPPASITTIDIESLGAHGGPVDSQEAANGSLKGVLVAGDSEVTGRARVLKDQNIDAVQEGEIIVARYMHPSWTPILPRLTGIVTEVGGWLSHTSILAREYNVTTITGIKKAEYRIRTGDLIRLKLDGTIEPANDGAATDGADATQSTAASDEAGDAPLAARQAGR